MSLFLAAMTLLGIAAVAGFLGFLIVLVGRAFWDCTKDLPGHRHPD